MLWWRTGALVTVQDICEGSILLNRDQVIAGMCHSSSRTSKTQKEVDRSSNCHRFVVSDTLQMKELSETSFERVHRSLCQPQSVLCLEPWSGVGTAPTQRALAGFFGKYLPQSFGWKLWGAGSWLLDLEGKS